MLSQTTITKLQNKFLSLVPEFPLFSSWISPGFPGNYSRLLLWLNCADYN